MKRKNESGFSLTLPSCSDLRGKQSVRGTFKLTERAISTLSIVASHLGIKQKSLFDHLIDDIQSLSLIAKNIQKEKFEKLNRVQKTYVLSRKTMVCLSKASEQYDAPRDALVEYSIQRLLPVLEEERERHLKRKTVQNEILNYLFEGEKLLKQSIALLGEEDPVISRFKNAVDAGKNAQRDIQDFIEKAKNIEEF